MGGFGLYITTETNIPIIFRVNYTASSLEPMRINTNGVINVNPPGTLNNKQLVLFDSAPADAPLTATNFFGNGAALTGITSTPPPLNINLQQNYGGF
jgi:hypothetical protein